MNEAWIRTLEAHVPINGTVVVLHALSPEHIDPLAAIGLDEELWQWTVSRVSDAGELAAYVRTALRERQAGASFPFAIVERTSGRVVGCTRYGNMDAGNRRLEIGWTWVGREFQRSPVNTETKYLLLRTAFETLECIRVEFKTDVLNERSRTALERIGAREEGILRKHMVTATGRIRDTVYYSILDAEWQDVGAQLLNRLERASA